GDQAAGPVGVVRRAVLPARVLDRLGGGRERQLGEAVGPAHLLDGEMLLGLELARAAEAVLDAGATRAPALVEGARADAQRRHRAHARDDDVARHPGFDVTRSTA